MDQEVWSFHFLLFIDVHLSPTTCSELCFEFKFKFKVKCLFFKPHMEEYKKITVNVLSRTYNITHINVNIIIQSITVFSLHTF